MTFVGKVLVVVQLVLSVCFMAFAGAVFAVQSNWKVKTEQVEKDLDESRTAVATLQGEKEALKQEMTTKLTDANDRADKAEGAFDKLKPDFDRLQNDLQEMTDERDKQQALAEIAGEEAKMRRVEAQLQRAVNSRLHEKLDKLSIQLGQRGDELFSALRTDKTVSDRYKKILEELAAAKLFLQQHDLELPKDFRSLVGKTPPPPIVQGMVLDVGKAKRGGSEFVEISLGSDDGLLQTHSLYVFRAAARNNGRAKFLGKIELVLLRPDRAVGKVVEKAKNGVIEKGDHVTTRL